MRDSPELALVADPDAARDEYAYRECVTEILAVVLVPVRTRHIVAGSMR